MAFARLMCLASKVDRVKNDLITEKRNAVKISHGETPKLSLRLKYRHFWIDFCYNLRQRLSNICSCLKDTELHRCCYRLRHDGTCENFTLKSVVGFIGGFLLTYVFFMFFVFQLNFKLSSATIMCALLGSVLTIGLAFSHSVRCIVFLLLPQFFSKRGRQALLAYAFILAITGPAKNTLNNMSILSESLACGQEQLKAAVKQIIDVIKKPFYAIKDAIKTVVKTVKVIVKKIKEILLTIKRIVMAIVRVIKAAFQFLGKILNFCNKELGTPFERCARVFENAISDCNAKLGPLFNWLCSVAYLVKSVCYIVKMFDFICMIVDFISNSVIGVVVRKIKTFIRHIRTMFYVRIRFSHSFHFQTNQSKTMSEVAEGIITEIRHRSEGVLTVFDLMSCATSLFFFFIIVKAMQYRYRFLTNERFDNIYITNNFRRIDLRRAKLEKETVLPLNKRERNQYVPTGSLRLVQPEKRSLSKSAVVLCTATVKLCTHMMTDYALFWMLTVIRYHARFQSKVKAPNVPGLHIEGNGLLADLLRSIVTAFQPLGLELEIDTIPCLPDPIPPDYDRYIQIVSLLVLCWILTVFEPYGLRLRHKVMCYYHPVRAKQRAVWLYNHIMRSRSSFLKFARRQLRRKITGSKQITKITCKEYLRANIQSPWLRLCLGPDKQEACLLCGEVFRESDKAKPIKCQTPNCPGIYCEECFADLQNLCTVCLDPIEYGDLSDVSEEKDSSEEEDMAKRKAQEKRKKKKKCKRVCRRCCPCSKCYGDDSDSDEFDRRAVKADKTISTSSKVEEGTTPGKTPTSRTTSEDDKTAHDSDYSSGDKTDYSYTYQDQKDVTTPQETTTSKSSFIDAEKQHIPDYAYMDSYRDVGTNPSDEEVFLRSVEVQAESLEVSAQAEVEHPPSEKKTSRGFAMNVHTRLKDFLKRKVFSKPPPVDIEEEEKVRLLEEESVLEATLSSPRAEETRRSIHSEVHSSSDTDITKPPEKALPVPPLHLSSLNSSSDVSTTYRSLYGNVKYEVVRETSSVPTDFALRDDAGSGSEISTVLRRRQITNRSSSEPQFQSSKARREDERRMLHREVSVSGSESYGKYDEQKRKVREYYRNAAMRKPCDNRRDSKMTSNLMKFVRKIFQKAPKAPPVADDAKSSSDDIDKVFLLSPKSPVCGSSDESSNSASSEGRSLCSYSSTTSYSTLMGNTPKKHLRAGAETGTFLTEENQQVNAVTGDLDSSDSDISLLTDTGSFEIISNPAKSSAVSSKSAKKVVWERSEANPMTLGDEGEISPSTKIYSREPPERDESNHPSESEMRKMSNQALHGYPSASKFQSKGDASMPNQRSKPEEFFNTSLIDEGTESSSPRECDHSTCTMRNMTALQKYRPRQYAIDDDGTYSESTTYEGRCTASSVPSCEGSHQIKHYRSRCGDRRIEQRCRCHKCKCRCCQVHPYPDADETTCYSTSTLATDFMDLAYQNNNEYLGLVHELEDTLSQRNKERVRKTMMQFEYLSRNNKSLEKPIVNYDDEETDTCSCQSSARPKSQRRRPRSASGSRSDRCQRKQCICEFSRRTLDDCDHRLSLPPPNAGYVGGAIVEEPAKTPAGSARVVKMPRCRTKWRMDPRTGEWYKVYDEHERFGKERPRRRKQSPPEYRRDAKEIGFHARPEQCPGPRCCCCRRGGKF